MVLDAAGCWIVFTVSDKSSDHRKPQPGSTSRESITPPNLFKNSNRTLSGVRELTRSVAL